MKATTTARSYYERVQAARAAAWRRENERIANPPKEIDWNASVEAGKTIFKNTK